ncbi:MAG TPA: response regulator [Burkholderiales bacterium]|nr:response regulator [Burkholderiales bacterium]
MSARRVLIIEDDPHIRHFVHSALEAEGGFTVFEAADAARGAVEAGTRKPDLLIVDLGLPDRDGRALIAEIRNWSQVPIIVLSAREREEEKVAALDAGADDYLVKPFGVPELLARIRAQFRRSAVEAGEPVFSFGDVVVDLARRSVTRAGAAVHLTPIEYRLLAALIHGHGRVLTHRQLMQETWGPNYTERAHYLRIYMGQLRHKLESDPAQPKHLLTETGVGYRLVA